MMDGTTRPAAARVLAMGAMDKTAPTSNAVMSAATV